MHIQIINRINRTTCLSVALLALGLAGCASDPNRTYSQEWADSRTSSHVKSALDKAPTYKFPNVKVSTVNGIVSLSGFVSTDAQKQDAVQRAQTVTGVRQVIDNIVIRPLPTGRPPVVEHPKEIRPANPPSTPNPATNPNQNPNNTENYNQNQTK